VHTHSTYATAWAARGEPVPCVLTMCADEFGGEIPVGPFAIIGDDSIGRGNRGHVARQPCPRPCSCATTASSPSAPPAGAVKAAVMCEDVARTVHVAASSARRWRSTRRTTTPSSTGTRTSTGQR
jgi:L-ribulose-5-phosphate 4-epimerase